MNCAVPMFAVIVVAGGLVLADESKTLNYDEVEIDSRGSIVRTIRQGEKEFKPTDWSWDKRDAVFEKTPPIGTPQPVMKKPKGFTAKQWAIMQQKNEDAKYRTFRRTEPTGFRMKNVVTPAKRGQTHRSAPPKLTVIEKRRAWLLSDQK